MSNSELEPRKTKKERSPSYPSIDLQAALARADQVRLREGRNFAPIPSLTEAWGYGPKSSGGLLAVAALKRFGLLEDRGSTANREARLTELAFAILVDEREDGTERLERIREAAMTPRIHREVWEHYQGNLPSDSTLRYYLTMEQGFTQGGAEDFVSELRQTLEFAEMDSDSAIVSRQIEDTGVNITEGGIPTSRTSVGAVETHGPARTERPGSRRTSGATGATGPTGYRGGQGALGPTGPATGGVYHLPVAQGATVTIQGPFPLAQGEWDQMIAVLNAMKPALVGTDPQTQVNRELSLIPRGDLAQNLFRMAFNALRLNSLSAHPEGATDLPSVFERAVKSVRDEYPDFKPQYDSGLFPEPETSASGL
jgi:hypothetical protein